MKTIVVLKRNLEEHRNFQLICQRTKRTKNNVESYTVYYVCPMWQGLQSITKEDTAVIFLPMPLYQTKDMHIMHAFTITTSFRVMAATDPEGLVISRSKANVSKVFNQVNIHKAAGPDGIPGDVLRACAEQLAGIFTVIYNLALSQPVIPTCFR